MSGMYFCINLEVGDYRHLRNPHERIEELNRLNEKLNQDLENKNRRFTEDPNPTRKPTRNRNYDDSYRLTNDGIGVDLHKEYDWDQILDNSKHLKEQRKPPFEINKVWDDVGKAWDEFSILPDECGFTFAMGLTGGPEAGASASGALGSFFTVDFAKSKVVYGNYGSAELGAAIGLPVPSIDGGVELSIFNSPDYLGAMEGKYNLSGGQIGFGPALQIDKITTIPGLGAEVIHRAQLTLGFSTPQAEVHTKFGYGEIITTPQEVKFKDIPAEVFKWIF